MTLVDTSAWIELLREGGTPAALELGRLLGAGLVCTSGLILAEVLSGAAPRQLGIALPRNRRRLVQLAPALALALGPGEADLGLQLPLAGRNLPSDPGLGVGYRISW